MLAIECESRAAGVLVHEQHAIPRHTAVRCAIHAALLLRPGRAAKGTDIHKIRIRRMHDDLADASDFLETDVLPRRARIGRLVDAVAHHVRVADGPRFAGAGPHNSRVRRRNRECPDRLHTLVIEDRPEGARAVGRLPDATRGGAEIVGRCVAGDTRHGSDAPAVFWAYVFKTWWLQWRWSGTGRTTAALGEQRMRRDRCGNGTSGEDNTNKGQNTHRQ